MPALAGTHNFIADWGVDFTRAVIKKDSKKRVVPLTGGYTARMVIHVEDHFNEVLHTATTENGGIQIDAPRGMLALFISDTDMTGIPVGKYHHYIDLIDPDGLKERMLRGHFTVREP